MPAQTAQPGEPTNLSYRYGVIGIQAVAAAARYDSVRKKPADAAPPADRPALRGVRGLAARSTALDFESSGRGQTAAAFVFRSARDATGR